VTVDGAAVGQLENALSNLQRSTVNFVKEKHNAFLAALLVPIGRIPSGTVAVNNRQTNKVAFSHLGGTTLHNRQTSSGGELINSLRLADTVTTPNHNGITGVRNSLNNAAESLKVHTHLRLRVSLRREIRRFGDSQKGNYTIYQPLASLFFVLFRG
jgi:hypothetical protein